MKALHKLTSLLALCFAAAGLASNVYAHDAKVVKLVGSAEITLPGETVAKPLTADMAVPEGATVKTGNGSQVFLEVFPGGVATLQPNATVVVAKLALQKSGDKVTSQEAMLDLKQGSIVSTLDPAKKAINHYGVRTPKGVAAARGTVYGVTVNAQGTSVATLHGTVTLNLGNGITVNIPLGSAVVNNSETLTSLAAAIAASGQEGLTVSQLLQEAVQVVADNVAANTSAAGGGDTATTVMAAVVGAAAAADPANAASFTQTAVAAVTSSTSATGGNASAVAAVTEAAVRAAPAQAASVAQAAAAAVVETKVTQAVNAAKASGGDTAAAAAAAQTEAAAVVNTVNQTAVSTAGAVGANVDAGTITQAVNAGAATGTTAANTNTGTSVAPPAPVVTPTPAAPAPDVAPPPPVVVTPVTNVELPPVSPSTPPQ